MRRNDESECWKAENISRWSGIVGSMPIFRREGLEFMEGGEIVAEGVDATTGVINPVSLKEKRQRTDVGHD
jgi:hypothetical protein